MQSVITAATCDGDVITVIDFEAIGQHSTGRGVRRSYKYTNEGLRGFCQLFWLIENSSVSHL